MGATIKDIALKIGISNQAVSAVLNGKTNSRVSKLRREQILKAAREMNYQPNAMAATLRNGKSRLIGVLTDSYIGYRSFMMLQNIEHLAEARGYRVITSFTHDNIRGMHENYQFLLNHGIPGVICLSHDYPKFGSEMRKAFSGDGRIVFMEKTSFPNLKYITTSRKRALTGLFADYVKQGVTRIGIAYGNLVWSSERALLAEYKEALMANGLPFDPVLTFEYPSPIHISAWEDSQLCIERMIEPSRPQLLFIDDAEHALCIQSCLITKSWRIPGDIVLYGGNGDNFFQCANPRIGSFDPCYHEMAEALFAGAIGDPFENAKVIEAVYKPHKEI